MYPTQLLMKECYQYAIKLLTKRDYSRFKLSQKLLERGHSSSDIQITIDELLEKKFLREDYYIEARVKGLLRKNYGPYYIQQKLREEEIECSAEYIKEVAQDIQLSATEQITSIANKKIRLLNRSELEYRDIQKIIHLAHRKGHSLELAKQVVSSLFQ